MAWMKRKKEADELAEKAAAPKKADTAPEAVATKKAANKKNKNS